MALLRFLFITICIIWIIRMLARLILPSLFQSMVNKATNQAGSNQRQQNYQQKKDGKLRVDFIPPKDREAKAADKAGEFVDYEEVK